MGKVKHNIEDIREKYIDRLIDDLSIDELRSRVRLQIECNIDEDCLTDEELIEEIKYSLHSDILDGTPWDCNDFDPEVKRKLEVFRRLQSELDWPFLHYTRGKQIERTLDAIADEIICICGNQNDMIPQEIENYIR